MNDLKTIARALNRAKQAKKTNDSALARDVRIRQLTVSRALSGKENHWVTTLLALATRLELEVMLVRKGAALAIRGPSESISSSVPTIIVDRLKNL